MSSVRVAPVRPLSLGMRRMLMLAAGLVFIVGISLFLLSEQTDQYFAWTVKPPLMAAFLGGGYWASVCLEMLAACERVWVLVGTDSAPRTV